MKVSLWKDIRTYSKTKGTIPLDERQMDALQQLYVELAKTMVLGFMMFMVAYGFQELRAQKTDIPYLTISMYFLAAICYYYMLRFCYQNVIGLDVNFEIILIPALFFTPFLFLHSIQIIMSAFHAPTVLYDYLFLLIPVMFAFVYGGANHVYKKGKQQQEKELLSGELHFRSRRLISNYVIIAIILLSVLPTGYAFLFETFIIASSVILLYVLYRYGVTAPTNDYILNEEGIIYQKTMLGRRGGFISYSEISDIIIQDTFNIGYAKDKVKLLKQDGTTIFLFPENAYRFCLEIKNNL